MFFKLTQAANALSPIVSKPSGKVIFCNELHALNAAVLIAVKPAGSSIFDNELHPLNAELGITVTLLGILTFLRFTQLKKALSPIPVSDSGSVMLSNELHFEKA